MKKELSVRMAFPKDMRSVVEQLAGMLRSLALDFFDAVDIVFDATDPVQTCPGCHRPIGLSHTTECPVTGTGVQ